MVREGLKSSAGGAALQAKVFQVNTLPTPVLLLGSVECQTPQQSEARQPSPGRPSAVTSQSVIRGLKTMVEVWEGLKSIETPHRFNIERPFARGSGVSWAFEVWEGLKSSEVGDGTQLSATSQSIIDQ
jgi:hypothetical protein